MENIKQSPPSFILHKAHNRTFKVPPSQTIDSKLTSASPAQLQRDAHQNGRLHGALGFYGLHLNIYGGKNTNCHLMANHQAGTSPMKHPRS